MTVEVCCLGGEGIDDDGPSAEFVAAAHAARECVDEQVPAKGLSLFGAIEREAGKQHDGHRVWHPAA